jgi:hypothetical protein
MITHSELKNTGYTKVQLNLPLELHELIVTKNYQLIDQFFTDCLKPMGFLSEILKNYGSFQSTEHILTLRSAEDPLEPDEDGIWHDDGSRFFAFSLGLNLKNEMIAGGDLLFRLKGQNEILFRHPPLAYGELLVFLTGIWGFEHKVEAVTKGQRLHCAGWLS